VYVLISHDTPNLGDRHNATNVCILLNEADWCTFASTCFNVLNQIIQFSGLTNFTSKVIFASLQFSHLSRMP